MSRGTIPLVNRQLLAYIVVVVGLMAGLFVYSRDQNEKLTSAQLTICDRLNIVRAQSNISDLASWRVLSATIQANPDRAIRFATQANDMTVIPLTNCKRAVSDPGHFPAALPQRIGDPETGELRPQTHEIEAMSRRITRPEGVIE